MGAADAPIDLTGSPSLSSPRTYHSAVCNHRNWTGMESISPKSSTGKWRHMTMSISEFHKNTRPSPTQSSILDHPMYQNSLKTWSTQWDTMAPCTDDTLMRMKPWSQGKKVEKNQSVVIGRQGKTDDLPVPGNSKTELQENWKSSITHWERLKNTQKKSAGPSRPKENYWDQLGQPKHDLRQHPYSWRRSRFLVAKEKTQGRIAQWVETQSKIPQTQTKPSTSYYNSTPNGEKKILNQNDIPLNWNRRTTTLNPFEPWQNTIKEDFKVTINANSISYGRKMAMWAKTKGYCYLILYQRKY